MIGHRWDELRPGDGEEIEFYEQRSDTWHRGLYFNAGIDGLVAWPDGDEWEVEEYGRDMFTRWRETWT